MQGRGLGREIRNSFNATIPSIIYVLQTSESDGRVNVRDLRFTSLKKGDMLCSLRNVFDCPTRKEFTTSCFS